MRTTITLDDRLFAKIKQRAAESGSSMSRFIEQAIRLMLQPSAAASPEGKEGKRFELVTFGAGGHFTGYNVDKASVFAKWEDRERFGQSE